MMPWENNDKHSVLASLVIFYMALRLDAIQWLSAKHQSPVRRGGYILQFGFLPTSFICQALVLRRRDIIGTRAMSQPHINSHMETFELIVSTNKKALSQIIKSNSTLDNQIVREGNQRHPMKEKTCKG